LKWENRLTSVAGLLAAAALAITPLIAAALGCGRLTSLPPALDRWLASRTVELATGYVALALVAAALILPLRLRTRLPLPYPRSGARAVHMVLGSLPLAVLFAHTGGRWGVHLNRVLLGCFLLAAFVALTGKLVESWLLRHLAALAGTARGERAAARAGAATAPGGLAGVLERSAEALRFAHLARRLRSLWPRLHLLLVAAMLVLVAFHVLCVYYYP
jgi:hypothetical protein